MLNDITGASTTSMSIIYHPGALTDEPNPGLTEYKLTMSELQMVGTLLLVFSLISIIINCYFSVLIFMNWETFRKSLYFNTNLLCLLLTLADLVFITLLGFPTALHLTWINYFKSSTFMHVYFRKFAHILFQFIFYLRIIIIAVLSADRCLHLLRSAQYSRLATKRKMKYVVGLMIAVPVLMDLMPTLIVFCLNDKQVICGRFEDPSATTFELTNYPANFTIPLTCQNHLQSTPPGSAIPLFDVTVIMTITILAFCVIVVSNLSIILMILKHAMKPINKDNPERRKKMTKNLTRSSIMVVFIAVLFFVSSFPYVWIWLTEFLRSHTTNSKDKMVNIKIMFFFIMLTFLPVIIHPWLYLLRMKSVKDMTPNLTKNVTKTVSKAVGNLQKYLPVKTSSSDRRTMLDVPNANTEALRMSPLPSPTLRQPNNGQI